MDLGQQMICQYWRNLLYSTYISNDNQSYQCIVLERTQEVGFGKQLVVFPQFQLEKIGFFFVICLFLTWCGVGFISKILGDIDMIYVLDNLIKVQQQFIYDDKPWLINLSIVCMLFFPPYPFSFQMNIYQIVNRIFDQGNFISVCIWQQVSPFPNVLFFTPLENLVSLYCYLYSNAKFLIQISKKEGTEEGQIIIFIIIIIVGIQIIGRELHVCRFGYIILK
eukprot:TRINITY_DN4541_c2_g1_i7.p2 TRINITY_DN4541_c2_g1~~TRINITY_DN4541_c2_g1_i7.p2  ORF type:complete len:222 (+),score=0.67 TRINITY_DN4541_c2_g1_i7:131-796(+)